MCLNRHTLQEDTQHKSQDMIYKYSRRFDSSSEIIVSMISTEDKSILCTRCKQDLQYNSIHIVRVILLKTETNIGKSDVTKGLDI